MTTPSFTQKLARTAAAAWTSLLDLLYPPQCLGCRQRLPDPAAPLCHRCVHNLDRITAEDVEERLRRLPEASALDSVRVPWRFDAAGTVQRVQHQLKYGNRPRFGVKLGELMAERVGAFTPLPDLIVPVPLHRTRLLERGYNQSAQLAQGLAETLGIPFSEDTITRTRATPSQTSLSRPERWTNVSGAFSVTNPDFVAGKHLLLVDDVLTTGATLVAAAHALRHANAASVHAVALALAG